MTDTRIYDFDTPVDRENTGAIKLDFRAWHGYGDDVLPLWVADMDFPVADGIKEALHERIDHGIFGYTAAWPSYYEAAQDWFDRHYQWRPSRESFVLVPGVVFGLNLVVDALTEPGDAILIQQPVYYPFAESARNQNRTLVVSPLAFDGERYTMDFEALEADLAREDVTLMILCNPHNPVGRAWTREELETVASLCLAHGVILVSDEIHADFARPGYAHVPVASLNEEVAQNCVICTAPSKTFNLAGLQCSNLFIPNRLLRDKVKQARTNLGMDQPNVLGMLSCEAAYRTGEPWLEQLKTYLEGNLAFMKDFMAQRLPRLRVIEPESTYLIWVDCSGLGMSHAELCQFFVHEAKVWLDDGEMFGQGGTTFMRFNIATQRSVLQQALEQLADAVERRNA